MANTLQKTGFLVAAFSFVLLLVTLQSVSAVECFVCSYSPRSNSSRIDGCTESNFTELSIDTKHCDYGCERVKIIDVNGELESYHRNCAHGDTPLTNECETHDTLAITKIVCACDSSYCNGSAERRSNIGIIIATVALLLVLCTSASRQ